MKKAAIIIAAAILVIGCGLGFFMVRGSQMAKNLTMQYERIETADLSRLADGVYPGSFGDFLVAVDLEVTVKDHRITGISIKKQLCGKGYEAHDMAGRIIRAQSARVDAVAGATGSSKCIMIAVDRALRQQL